MAKELEEIERLEALIPAPPSIWEARRTLRRQVRALQYAPVSDNGSLRDLTRDLVISTREYLRAELPEIRSGDTPRDIQRHVGGLQDGGRKEALAALSSRLVAYHGGLEAGRRLGYREPVRGGGAARRVAVGPPAARAPVARRDRRLRARVAAGRQVEVG